MNAAIRRDSLNIQAIALVDAQTEIKMILKEAVLRNEPFSFVNGKVQRAIKRGLARVRSPTLKSSSAEALNKFANKIFYELKSRLTDTSFIVAVLLLLSANTSRTERSQAERIVAQRAPYKFHTFYETDQKGVPLSKYMKDYLRKNVMPVFRATAAMQAKDPDSSYTSLRNLAEMQVRHETQEKEISALRSAGVRLVVCSVHADCSNRCAPWQGRVYSLDGTSGITEDGRRFVPLEEATDIFYTTKNGKRYKNGLLGFNCRHRLFQYHTGMIIPSVTKAEQQREYKITETQRLLERRVLKAREEAIAAKGIDAQEYKRWKEEAIRRNQEYMAYSKRNKRAYYPDRTKLL